MKLDYEKMSLELVDSTFAKFKEGKSVNGKVVFINNNGALINIGGKGDAFIYNEDFLDKTQVKEGDEITAIVVSKKDENGYIKLSEKRAKEIIRNNETVINMKEGDQIEITINTIVKGGMIGKLGDFNVFVPQSQVDYMYRNDLLHYKNVKIKCSVMDIDLVSKKIVASIRQLKEKVKLDQENNFWSNIEEGKLVKGIVKRFATYGVFVNVNGKDCLLHNNDVSYMKERAENIFTVDEEYDFVVLKADREENRVSLGYKQLMEDPRKALYNKYNKNQIVSGIVKKILPYGAIIELENGVAGFLHISEAGYGLRNMAEKFKVNETIETKILEVNDKEMRISLSINALNFESIES
ncbi:MAG: S1 RNA-binding domain-containing protein [Candidatus Cloacimonetes bacterium]|nr:S1 RNA-binding domain-containing protein [Candidatus Cloacimonadota bacterium]